METIISTCPNCKAETVEGYDVCWKCDFSFSERQVIEFVDVVPAMLPCPKTWLSREILITMFWFTPTGMIALYHASRVSAFYTAGYYEEAQLASKKASKWFLISFVLGTVFLFCRIYFPAF